MHDITGTNAKHEQRIIAWNRLYESEVVRYFRTILAHAIDFIAKSAGA